MGFQELVDAEQIVPALRLDLKEATDADVESAMADGLMVLEEAKCSGSGGMDMAKAYNSQSTVILIRLQMLAARARR
eukprot:11170679-Lingulodinium_polyedra.AAC.1